jgi:hypothetical protein
MRRYRFIAISATIITAGIASTLVATQGAGSLSPSADSHKTSSVITHSSKGTSPLTAGGHNITVVVPPRTLVVAPTTTTTTIVQQVVPVAPPTTVAPTPTTTVPLTTYAYGVTPADVAAWTRVAICEEGGDWHVRGYKYSGGLGILNTNWTYYSRGMGLPASAADATPIQQIAVAKRINAGYAVPDQNGCAAW